MTTTMIDELEIECGDMAYRNKYNHIRTHKLKMLDVLTEYNSIMSDKKDKHHSGKMYNHHINEKTHYLYEYFAKRGVETMYDNPTKWYNRPDWFVRRLKNAIVEIQQVEEKNYSSFNINRKAGQIELINSIIDKWVDNPKDEKVMSWCEWRNDLTDKGIDAMSKIYMNDCPVKPIWRLKVLFNKLNDMRWYKGEYYSAYNEDETIKKWSKKPDGTYYDNYNRDNKPPAELEIKIDAFRQGVRNPHNSLLYALTEDFTRFASPKLNSGYYSNIYTLKIRRTYNGDRMNYSASHNGRFSMLRWKKTMTNGNCSNKDLKATHLYYREKGDWGNKCGWIFPSVKIDDAIECAVWNGFPKWGKKGDGKKKPTYLAIKMWWYKLEDN